MTNAEHFDALARLLRYPEDGYQKNVSALRAHLEATNSPSSADIASFDDAVRKLPLSDCEELFTRTFEINPACALEVGWQLYGENYERGNFIVSMRQGMKLFDLPESSELPDHLSHVLQSVGRMKAEQASEFIGKLVLPAVKKMNEGLKDKDNPYRFVLNGILSELKARTTELELDIEGVTNG